VNKIFLFFALFNSGCGFFIAGQMMDKLIEMQKIKLAHEKEMRLQVFTIEGQIEKSESITKKIEVPTPVQSNNKIEVKSIPQSVEKSFFIVKFVDGREKEFCNIPSKPLNVGENYIIRYNGMNEIIDIDKIEK
jgi:pyruvate formate-lyase activating enzyme-like uncharacterized protein